MRFARPGFRSTVHLALVAVVIAAALNSFSSPVRGATGTADAKGTEFWLTFGQNYDPAQNAAFPLSLTLFITSDTNTNGTVTIPGLSVSIPFSVTAGLVTSVPIPSGAQLTTTDAVESKGIHVTAESEVTVYGLNRRPTSTDAFLGLPVDILGQEYITLGYANSSFSNPANETEFAIVGTQFGTTVTITPSVTTGAHVAFVPYTVVLNAGDTYQLRNGNISADLSGSIITADHPVAVFGGHSCADVPQDFEACDQLVEQLQPTTTWGRNFVTMPLATRQFGDTFRFLAQKDGTDVSVNGVVVATLNRGQLFEQIVEGPAQIVADEPILVAQYSNGSLYDGVESSDPFMVLVPPHEQFQASYTVTTPADGFSANFLNVVVPASAVATVTVDGVAPAPADIVTGAFVPIGTSGFSAAQIKVALGSHTVAAALPLGIIVYGFAEFDSYGYPGGMSVAPVAVVNTLTLTPETAVNPLNTQHCVTATVTDSTGAPVVSVRVDFSVEGSHAVLGFTSTDADGKATFCYLGTVVGDDTITASQGTLTDTATKTWQAPAPAPAKLVLSPKTAVSLVGTEHCVTAELTDQFEDPVPNTQIDFTVTQNHSVTGSSNTDAEGLAEFCYVGTVAGTDAIAATQGTLSDTASKIWEAPLPPPKECVRDEDEWKDPKTVWPVSSLTLGTVTYTKAQLRSILLHAARVDVRTRNGLVVLAADLIAAKLNRAKGAPVPANVASAIAAADALIGSKVVPPVGSGSLTLAATNAIDCTLTLYNTGKLRGGPRACIECVVKDDDGGGKGGYGKVRPKRPVRDLRPGKGGPHGYESGHRDGDRCVVGRHGHRAGDRCFGRQNAHHGDDGCDGRDFRHGLAIKSVRQR